LRFRINIEDDTDHGAPWEENDGHGVVSDWARRDKRPSELILNTDRGSKRFYDVAESTKIAKRDGWGLADEARVALEKKLGCAPTQGQIIAQAVQHDFEFLYGWCNDQWNYVGVIVTIIDGEDAPPRDYEHAVWGIQSNDNTYIAETANELVDDILHERRIAQAKADAEAIEVAYWNSRDVVTH
jgi:hypothetical protein